MTMRANLRSVSFFGLILALGLMVPVPALAQTGVGAVHVEEVHERTARILEREAEARSASLETYGEAGDLYRKAAYIRGEDDMRAVEDLRSAARLAHYEGRHERAVKDLKRAGDLARSLEMPTASLEAYYDAAWIAQRSGQYREAYRLVQRIGHLSRDPNFMIEVAPEVVARVVKLMPHAG